MYYLIVLETGKSKSETQHCSVTGDSTLPGVCGQPPSLILVSLMMMATPVPQLNLRRRKMDSLINQFIMFSGTMDITSRVIAYLRVNLFSYVHKDQELLKSVE